MTTGHYFALDGCVLYKKLFHSLFAQEHFSFPFPIPIPIAASTWLGVMFLFLTYSQDYGGQFCFMLDDTTANLKDGLGVAPRRAAGLSRECGGAFPLHLRNCH